MLANDNTQKEGTTGPGPSPLMPLKSILRNSTFDDNKSSNSSSESGSGTRSLFTVMFDDVLARDAETGEYIPQTTRPRSVYIAEVAARRSSIMIDKFRAMKTPSSFDDRDEEVEEEEDDDYDEINEIEDKLMDSKTWSRIVTKIKEWGNAMNCDDNNDCLFEGWSGNVEDCDDDEDSEESEDDEDDEDSEDHESEVDDDEDIDVVFEDDEPDGPDELTTKESSITNTSP